MNARAAKGRRWAGNTMKVFGIALIARLFFAFKTNEFRGLVQAVMILIIGIVAAAIAFGLGWLAAKNASPVPGGASNLPLVADATRTVQAAPASKSEFGPKDWLKGIGIVAVGALVIYSWINAPYRRQPAHAPAVDLATATAARLNVGLPKMVSSDSRLDYVVADPGRAVIYNYTMVGMPNASMDADTASRFRQLIVASTCGGASSDLFAHGIAIRDRYAREDGYVFADVTVRPQDCPQQIQQRQSTAGTLESDR